MLFDYIYGMFSNDTQVQTALENMYMAGITTYVIGFGSDLSGSVSTPAAAARGSLRTHSRTTVRTQG